MTAAFNELPLALFTTLASIGAGAFITLACAFFASKLSEEQLARTDKMAIIPAIVVIVGFIAAFFHLANPAGAFGVFAGIGRSPMSNEIIGGIVFCAVMAVYAIMGLAGKHTEGSRKALSAVLAVLAVVFAVLMGMAYSISTIPTWNSPWPVAQVIGFALIGGTALGMLVLALSGALEDALQGSFKGIAIALAVLGCALAVIGLAFMASSAGSVANAVVTGSALLNGIMVCLIVSIVCLVLAFASVFMATRNASATWPAIATILALVGVLAGRFVFYALQISVGISF